MQLTGLTEAQVDQIVADFTALMQKEVKFACFLAADDMKNAVADVIVASPFDALGAITQSWSSSVQTKLVPFLRGVFGKASKAIAAPLGKAAGKSPASVVNSSVIDDVAHNLTQFANDLYDAGHGAVMVGWQDGETVLAIADRIKSVADVKAAKAASIAQTAITTTVNGGEWSTMLAVAKKFDAITTKEWVATHDSHTRPTHWAADGQRIPLAAKFSVGNALLDFPGDPFGDLDEIINCRCTTKYDADIQPQNSTTQTSPDALSADSAVDTTEQISASAATNSNWKASDHPRGKNGKFIKKGVGLPTPVFDGLVALGGGDEFVDLSSIDKPKFIEGISEITPAQWANLTPAQRELIDQAVQDAIDMNWPGAATAQLHLDDLEGGDDDDVDLFDPDTPLPGGVAPTGVAQHIAEAANNGYITPDQESDLLDKLALGELTEDEAKAELMQAMTPAAASGIAKKDAEQAIYDAYDADLISEDQQDELLAILDNTSAPNMMKALEKMKAENKETQLTSWKKLYEKGLMTKAEYEYEKANIEAGTPTPAGQPIIPPSQSNAPITTGTPKPIKMTHGLIHAKHVPGTTIAVDEKGNRVVWNGSSYDIIDKNGDPVATNIKKSKLYALLNDFNGDAQWHEPGNESVDVTHASPLDAAPAPNPIPHPVNFPGTSSVDDALDDAFGAPNAGLAPAPLVDPIDALINSPTVITPVSVPSPTPAPLGELPINTKEDLLDGIQKLYEAGEINVTDLHYLTQKVNEGKMAGAKMVIGAHNSQVAKDTFVDTDDSSPISLGQISPYEILNNDEGFAPGEVIATGVDADGNAWNVAITHEGNVLMQPEYASSAQTYTQAQFVAMSNSQQITWQASDGSQSIFPAAPGKKVAPGKKTAPTTPSAPTTPPITTPSGAAALTPAQKKAFYDAFKAQNVSPAWSGAKIYASMHAAKLAMAGNPHFANLTDEEMLAILDQQHNLAKATSGTPYSTKTKEWLKTPNGIKAFKQLNPNIGSTPTTAGPPKKTPAKKVAKGTGSSWAATSSPSTTSAPAKKASPFTGTPIKNTGSWVVAAKKAPGKKAAVKKAAPVTGITPSEALGATTAVPASVKPGDVYTNFKSSGYGKYLNDSTPEEIYWNAVQIGKSQGLSPAQVLAIIDEEGAKKFGVPNAKSFEKKVSDWLATNSGQVTAARIKNGDWKPQLAAAKATSGAQPYAASTPLNEKVDDVSGHVPPFDESKTKADFPVLNTSQAAQLWDEMQAAHGNMTTAQRGSLRHYTTNQGFTNMNTYLRGQAGATQATQTHVDNAQAGMRPTTRDITIHRGNGWFTAGDGAQWTNYANIKALEGTDFHQESFFSASVGGKEAFSGKSISMEIEVPAGTPAAYVKAFSAYGGENELLLAANLTYRVVEVTQSGHQVRVKLRVVPNKSEVSS